MSRTDVNSLFFIKGEINIFIAKENTISSHGSGSHNSKSETVDGGWSSNVCCSLFSHSFNPFESVKTSSFQRYNWTRHRIFKFRRHCVDADIHDFRILIVTNGSLFIWYGELTVRLWFNIIFHLFHLFENMFSLPLYLPANIYGKEEFTVVSVTLITSSMITVLWIVMTWVLEGIIFNTSIVLLLLPCMCQHALLCEQVFFSLW